MSEYQAVDLGGFPVTETTPVVAGPSGRGIVSIARTSGDGSPGTDDTYTITYTYGPTTTFVVHNGADGESVGAVTSVNGLSGVVVLDAADVGADASGSAAAAQAAAATDATTKANAAKSGAEATAAGALSAHEADTTSVHGIANTALLETTSGAQSKANAAQAAAELTASDADNLTSGLVAQARLGSGSAGAGAKALFDDQTYKTIGGGGDMLASVYDPTTVAGDAFDRALHHGDVPAADVSGLATVATTGAYSDLSGKPTLGTAAAAATTDFATAAQGATADAAASGLAAHISDTTDAHDASAISSVAAGTLAATDVQAALNELDTEKATTGSVSTVATDLSNHLADTSDAHDASAISYAGGTGMSATDVEAAIDELATEKANLVSPAFTTPALGTPTSGVLTNCTGLPVGALVGVLPGSLIGYNARTAGTPSSYAIDSATSTPTDVDATNMAASFTVPASGQVRVVLSAFTSNDATGDVYWSLRSGSSNVATSDRQVTSTFGGGMRMSTAIVITGLTPAASVTYKWAWRTGCDTVNLSYGGTEFGNTYGPATIEVYAA